MNKMRVVEKGHGWQMFFNGVGVGAVLVAALFAVGLHFKNRYEHDQSTQAVKTCKLPDADGAMTVYVMESERIKCWRWK